MIILGIETSCDETALALIKAKGKTENLDVKVLGSAMISQIKIHEQYGGVFPMMAKREHAKNLIPLLQKLFKETKITVSFPSSLPALSSKLTAILEREPELLKAMLQYIGASGKPKIDAIAVTYGPGLEPALWVGINFAKALSLVWNIPIIPVNHMEGHIYSVILQNMRMTDSSAKDEFVTRKEKIEFPAIALLISGGHTELVLVKNFSEYEIAGKTRDDAVGEAFDKVARMLGLPYPGGPQISKLADVSRKRGATSGKWKFPRPMLHSDNLDFSFAGLKTSVLYAIKKAGQLTETDKEEIAREFEDSVVEVLVTKTKTAMEKFDARTLILGGGVTANKEIRGAFEKLANETGVKLFIPDKELSTDNGIMIAIAGYIDFLSSRKYSENFEIKAEGNLRFHNPTG